MASPAAPITKHQAPPHLADELLEQIFLRLPTPAALARASTACSSFRRIITDRSFRRRLRALHPPPLLGFVSNHGFHPAEPPHPSAPLARALADVADFSYSFVPSPHGRARGPGWRPRDVRDGRVLVEDNFFRGKGFSTNLAVCDPLSRWYVLLPLVPKDLASQLGPVSEFTPFLAPTGEDDETSFKVIGMAEYKSKLVVFVFSSITSEWCIAASPSDLSNFDYMRGHFYWAAPLGDRFLVMDICRMEFSVVDIPTNIRMQCKGLPRIVMGREGALEMCTVVSDCSPGASVNVYHATQQNNTECSTEWQVEHIIPLPGQYLFATVGAAEGFLFIRGPPSLVDGNLALDYFSLDVKTSELNKVCTTRLYPNEASHVHPYFGFPPSLSLPSL